MFANYSHPEMFYSISIATNELIYTLMPCREVKTRWILVPICVH